MESNNLSLAENFQNYFTIELASTPEEKQSVYEIRYRVYCEEFGYEPAESFPDQAEQDEYDNVSLHCLITHKPSGRPAGCVRMVPAVPVAGHDLLPFEKHCAEAIDEDFVAGLELKRQSMCEISRLAVDDVFRRRAGEKATRFGEIDAVGFSQQERRTFPLISVAGFLASAAIAELAGRPNGFAMMEPFLPKLMQRSGIVFLRAGRDMDYHGTRAPYFIRLQSVKDGMRADLKDLYDQIHGQIKMRYDESVIVNAR